MTDWPEEPPSRRELQTEEQERRERELAEEFERLEQHVRDLLEERRESQP